MQPVQQVIMKHGKTTTEQTHLQTQPFHHIRPDQQVIMGSSTTHQIHPTTEMQQCISDVVNKATWEMSVRPKECFAPTARMPATATDHAENLQIAHPAKPIATSQPPNSHSTTTTRKCTKSRITHHSTTPTGRQNQQWTSNVFRKDWARTQKHPNTKL